MKTDDLSDLIDDALGADADTAAEAIMTLERRGDRATFDAMRALLDHPEPRRRAFAADVLGQLAHAAEGEAAESLPEQCFDALAKQLTGEDDPAVLAAIGVAFGHLHDPRAVELVLPLATHGDDRVRHGVVMALMGHDTPEALGALIGLSTDADDDIRNWATFALGTQTEVDTPALRAALIARLDDRDPETRGEAFVGLAERGDETAVPVVAATLKAGLDARAIEAAARLGHPDLHAPLVALRAHPEMTARYAEELDEAIARCAEPTE